MLAKVVHTGEEKMSDGTRFSYIVIQEHFVSQILKVLSKLNPSPGRFAATLAIGIMPTTS